MNILLDTNVLSESVRGQPHPTVLTWLALQRTERLFVAAITQAEMLLGARLLPAGKRKHALEAVLGQLFDDDFAGRVLPFDSQSARRYADIVAARKKAGRPLQPLDAQIAAVAYAHGMPVATRNVRDFEDCGVVVINPWLSD
jgi:toxin FitB